MFAIYFLVATFGLSFVKSSCDLNGDIQPDYWQKETTFSLNGCPGSYFKVDLNPIKVGLNKSSIMNYRFEFESVSFANEESDLTLNLASVANLAEVKVTAPDSAQPIEFPFVISYLEITELMNNQTNGQENGTLSKDSIRSNSLQTFELTGFADLRLLDLTYEMPDNLGFVAMENGNGRITLFTNPKVNNLKVTLQKLHRLQK